MGGAFRLYESHSFWATLDEQWRSTPAFVEGLCPPLAISDAAIGLRFCSTMDCNERRRQISKEAEEARKMSVQSLKQEDKVLASLSRGLD
jgi:hypothetical protein